MAQKKSQKGEPIVIKKYANRRLYNTATSSYVTLEHLCKMVKSGQDFVVYDARTGEDITHSVLTQIIFEEENRGQNMLPIDFLRQLICFYGDTLQSALPAYLEMSMKAFANNQEKIRESLDSLNLSAMKPFENLARQNLALFEQAFNMFAPFAKPSTSEPPKETASQKDKTSDQIDALKRQLDLMQKQLEGLAAKKTEN